MKNKKYSKFYILLILGVFLINFTSAWCIFGIIGNTCDEENNGIINFEIINITTSNKQINVFENSDGLTFSNEYFNLNMDYIDFFVPEELQDDLAYITPCDENLMVCQGDSVDAIYGQTNLFHILNDWTNEYSDAFYVETDYLFQYAMYDSDNDIPEGFNYKRINSEIRINYSNENNGLGDILNSGIQVDSNSRIDIDLEFDETSLTITWNFIYLNNLVGSFSRTFTNVIPNEYSNIQFIDGDLEVNNLLRKWNGKEFVISGDVWINEPQGNTFKFGANDTIATENTLYQYEWKSNKDIELIGKFYYFDFENSKIVLNTKDICSDRCLEYETHEEYYNYTDEETNETINGISNVTTCINYFYTNCVYSLSEDKKNLLVNFTGYYDSNFGGIFIDPTFGLDGNINFTSPTPSDGSSQSSTSIYVNYTATSSNDIYSFINYDNSLVGWWRLDNSSAAGENDTLVYDWSGNGNNGTVVNATVNSSGRFGGDFEFDGAGDYIDAGNLNNAVEGINTITISAWAKSDATDIIVPQKMIEMTDQNNLFSLYYDAFEQFNCRMYADTSPTSTGDQSLGTDWHYVACVYDGSKLSIYVDSVLQQNDQENLVGNLISSTSNLDLGGESGGWNGSIDEVMIFNRSLSAEEIVALYNATKTYHNFTNQDVGTHTFQAYAVDENGNMNYTELRSVTISNATPDTEYPKFSNYYDNNGTLIDSGTGIFNVTVESTNGTVFLEIDGNNITATNLTSNIYNASYDFASGGVYSYKWLSWGNGTSNNFNISEIQSYTVNTTANSCTPTSPLSSNHIFECSDNCDIRSLIIDANGNDIIINGTGSFIFNSSSLFNYNQISLIGESSINKCNIIRTN